MPKYSLYILSFVFYFAPANAQGIPDTCYSDVMKGEEEEIFNAVINVDASFKGGKSKWSRFLQNNLDTERILSGLPDSTSFSDSIVVRFVVSKTGGLSNLEILHAGSNAVKDEMIRVIKRSCPMWEPAVAPSGRTINAWHKETILLTVNRMADTVSSIILVK